MREPKGLAQVRRNRNEDIPMGIRNLLVQPDPHTFQTIGPAVEEEGATISGAHGAIRFVVER